MTLLLRRQNQPQAPICAVAEFSPSRGRLSESCSFQSDPSGIFESVDVKLRALIDSRETVEITGQEGMERVLCRLVVSSVVGLSVEGVLQSDVFRMTLTKPPPSPLAPPEVVRGWLRAVGAPLVRGRWITRPAPPLEQLVAEGVRLAHEDGWVALAMPIVISRNRARLRLDELTRIACKAGEGAALGVFLDLTAELANDGVLADAAASLTASSSPTDFFTGAGASFARHALVTAKAPPAARRWGFRMNVSLNRFEGFFRKHGALPTVYSPRRGQVRD